MNDRKNLWKCGAAILRSTAHMAGGKTSRLNLVDTGDSCSRHNCSRYLPKNKRKQAKMVETKTKKGGTFSNEKNFTKT